MPDKEVLAYASQYKEKYYFNDTIGTLPDEIRKEVLVLLILLTEEAGGVAEFAFDEDGEVRVDSWCEEGDLGYDAVSAGLLIREIEREHADLLEQLNVWYRAMKKRKASPPPQAWEAVPSPEAGNSVPQPDTGEIVPPPEAEDRDA